MKNNILSKIVFRRHRISKIQKIMRLSTLFLLCCLCSYAGNGFSQSAKVSIEKSNVTLSEILTEIETQTNYLFIYKNTIDVDKNVTVKAKNKPVSAVLDQIFKNTDTNYVLEGSHIILTKNEASASARGLDAKQQSRKKISGTVLDEEGEPIIGASVAIPGTTIGTMTGIDGDFVLEVPEDAEITVSFIGYVAKKVSVKGQTQFNIVLQEDAKILDEVVVTALGIKRQAKAIGYSTSQVSGSDFTEARDLNLGNALSGKIAGVSVANNATGSGGSSRVTIRGNASLTGNNQPLYVIDGIPFDNTSQNSAGKWGGVDLGDGLSNINPDDIESMQVLKGAAASALYGYRGGNGAILITTKSGAKADKGIGIEINNNLTINSVYDYRDFQKSYGQGTQGVRPTSQSAALDTYSSSWGDRLDGGSAVNFLGDTYRYKYVNNWDHFYKTGVTNQTSIAASGSSDKVVYRVGLSNVEEWSVIPNAGLTQQGINLNTTYDITSKLHFTVTANYVFEKVRNRANLSDGNANVNASLMYLANSYDVRWLKPAVNDERKELLPGNNVYFNNPYFLTHHRKNTSRRNRLTGGLTLKYDITDWLYAQGQVTRDGYTFEYLSVQPTGAAQDPGGYIEEYEKNFYELNANYMFGFDKRINEMFSINAALGGNMQRNVDKYYGTDGNIGPFIIPYFYSTGNVANRSFRKEYKEYKVNSIYATAEFGFKDYLFLNVTGRNDWFSTLSKEDNSYFYPSVSTSFMFSDALKMPDWVYSGKWRLSYAQASNGTTPYENYLTYALEKFKINEQPVGNINNTVIPNPNLKPIQISEWETGLNVQFLDNRLGLDMAVYKKTTKDDIVRVTTSITSGYQAAIMNIGEIENKGLELMLYGTPIKTNDFMWNATFNFSHNKSKVKNLGGREFLSVDGAEARNGSASIRNILGSSYGQIVGYKYKRNENGDVIYDAATGYPMRTDDVESLGSGVYKYTGGIRNEFKYRDFSFSFLLDYKFGANVFSGTNHGLTSAGLHKKTLQGREGRNLIGKGVVNTGTDANPIWTPNTTAVDPELYWRHIANEATIDEEFVSDASFVKLREISLGYNVPRAFLTKTPFKSVYVSLIGRNLWTIMKHTSNIDPESSINNTNGQGLELNGYPPTRSYGFNINVKF